MPQNRNEPFVETNLHFRRLTTLEATAYLIGTNVGAAVLALPYAAGRAGFITTVIACLAATFFSLVSHLFLVESMLRTMEVTQLTGLFRTYLFRGRAGFLYIWFLFALTIGVAIPTLTAYVLGGASSLAALTGAGIFTTRILFLLAGSAVVWLGLKTTGIMQKLAGAAMAAVLLILTCAALGNPSVNLTRLTGPIWTAGFRPVLPIAVFTCMSQAVVPEIVRGLAHKPHAIPVVVRRALLINFGFCLLVLVSVLSLLPAREIHEVATISWGRALGAYGAAAANLFAFFALLTSFWGTAGTILTNVVDVLRFPSEWRVSYRLIAFAVTILPTVLIIAGRFWGFVDLVEAAGAVGGVLLALLPVVVLRRSRRFGDRIPEYIAPSWMGPPVQAGLFLFYLGALVCAAFM